MRKALPRHKAERAVQEWGSINEAAKQLGAYKVIDSYSESLGYVTPRYGSACLTVIDPLSPPPGRVMVFWDVAAGATYLSHLRASRK